MWKIGSAHRGPIKTYKNTLKTMVGINPQGVVTYVLDSYGGSCKDRQSTGSSSLLKDGTFKSGNSIMADRGILIQDLFSTKNVQVDTPTSMGKMTQSPAEAVVSDCRIARKQVHVERVIRTAKNFKILTELNHRKTPHGGRIIYGCLCENKFVRQWTVSLELQKYWHITLEVKKRNKVNIT